MGIEYLLALNGEEIEFDDGYWVKFETQQVDKSPFRPHGIKYSLTLHRPDGERILGFDNAHAVKKEGNPYKYVGQIFPYDHEHLYQSKVVPYYFNSGEQLVTDFWTAVNKALDEEKQR